MKIISRPGPDDGYCGIRLDGTGICWEIRTKASSSVGLNSNVTLIVGDVARSGDAGQFVSSRTIPTTDASTAMTRITTMRAFVRVRAGRAWSDGAPECCGY